MFYSKLTVYRFQGKKLKIDYSTIPVKKISDNVIKSEVSDMEITLNKKPYFHVKGSYTVSLVSEDFNEEDILKTLKESFDKHFWYKFSYRKFLNKKIKQVK